MEERRKGSTLRYERDKRNVKDEDTKDVTPVSISAAFFLVVKSIYRY
jgi:hypothetical protein